MQRQDTDTNAVMSHVIDALSPHFGDRLVTSWAMREQHGHDESWHAGAAPDAVVFPHSTDEVSLIVSECARHKVAVIPFGAGTSLEGHVAAVRGGVTIDMSQMADVVRVSAEDLDCTVQAGITRKTLNAHLRDTGLFMPVDPGADATVGGMVSTRASGTNAVRYGTVRENVLGLTVVLADGSVVRTGGRARKSASGYDLTHLLTGAEGTLGVITEITLRLHGIPEETGAATCSFASVDDAVATVIQTIQSGIPVARIELLDDVMVRACNAYSQLGLPEQPMLFLEFHGSAAGVREQAQRVADLAQANGGGDFEWATRAEDRTRLWEARHSAYYAALALSPGRKGFTTDVCVPVSQLAGVISQTRADVEEAHLIAPLVGHVGDGNFHLILLVDPDDGAEVDTAQALHARLVMRALAAGGTCTGEHGIGIGKKHFLALEHGDAVDMMRAIKKALDPDGIMNPGKMLPDV
ncbi:FAD-linked oxidase C-terminal domain-containing protein [Pyruvatibacter sp.]|uniref:FAD-binding oxidoreductase n=1 Tax=Pyruvatibacter sp. TaxID=1981328 RepID=UPI0032EC2222